MPPNRIFVQGWITKGGKKLSKTTGNVIDPEALVSQWGPDAVRYFLLREGTYGQDWDVTDAAILSTLTDGTVLRLVYAANNGRQPVNIEQRRGSAAVALRRLAHPERDGSAVVEHDD